MMLDHDHGVPLFNERMQNSDEALAVTQMQADGRLFKKVKVAYGGAARAVAHAGQSGR
jgi:hypothetical protein